MITIVDYGMGNLGSIQNMFNRIGISSVITTNVTDLKQAKKILLPGVGAFDAAMNNINQAEFRDVLTYKAQVEQIPILGICLGMQLMCQSSEEGILGGLGWIDATVKRFNVPKHSILKVPHMGWNTLEILKPNALIEQDIVEKRFYFVHSYHVVCDNSEDILARTYHAHDVTAAFHRKNLFGAQFHPEKSHRFGMKLFENFAKI